MNKIPYVSESRSFMKSATFLLVYWVQDQGTSQEVVSVVSQNMTKTSASPGERVLSA